MRTATVDAPTQEMAKKECLEGFGFWPDAVRPVDSGEEDVLAWMCFESASDAETWDKQQ